LSLLAAVLAVAAARAAQPAPAQDLQWATGAKNNDTTTPYSSACVTGNYRPTHGNIMPQNSPSPYTVTVYTNMGGALSEAFFYQAGQEYTVKISGNGLPITAFHFRGDNSEPTFNGSISCVGGKLSNFCNDASNPLSKVEAVTNVDVAPKAEVTCTWRAPDHSIGGVQFVATIVQNYDQFWTGVRSQAIIPAASMMSYAEHQQRVMQEKMALARVQSAALMKQMNAMIANAKKQHGQSSMGGMNGMSGMGALNGMNAFNMNNMNSFMSGGEQQERPTYGQAGGFGFGGWGSK